MATIQSRPQKNGTVRYRVMIRQSDGFPPVSKTFPRKEEAKHWAQLEEARRRQGYGPSDHMNGKKTLADLIDRYMTTILPTKPKDARNMKRHLEWWREKIGKYGLTRISSDLIAQCRQELANGETSKKIKREQATVNRYLATLSTLFTYGVNECGWITDNPCRRVTKFKEAKGRDRIVSINEWPRLFEACKKSKAQQKNLKPLNKVRLIIENDCNFMCNHFFGIFLNIFQGFPLNYHLQILQYRSNFLFLR